MLKHQHVLKFQHSWEESRRGFVTKIEVRAQLILAATEIARRGGPAPTPQDQ